MWVGFDLVTGEVDRLGRMIHVLAVAVAVALAPSQEEPGENANDSKSDQSTNDTTSDAPSITAALTTAGTTATTAVRAGRAGRGRASRNGCACRRVGVGRIANPRRVRIDGAIHESVVEIDEVASRTLADVGY